MSDLAHLVGYLLLPTAIGLGVGLGVGLGLALARRIVGGPS